MLSSNELEFELNETLELIDAQIRVLRGKAERRNVSVHQIRDEHGNYLIIPLLTAKAQILSSLERFVK